MSDDQCSWVQLDHEAATRLDQSRFHICAEGALSDFRAEIVNLGVGHSVAAPSVAWPDHLCVLLCIRGVVQAQLAHRTFELRPLSQLVVLPGVECSLIALEDASLEIMSFNTRWPPAARR